MTNEPEVSPGRVAVVFSRRATPVGDAPVITSNGGGATAAVAVSAPAKPVTTITATGTATVKFSIIGGPGKALFSLNQTTGALAFIAASVAGEWSVNVSAINNFGNADQYITVTVT